MGTGPCLRRRPVKLICRAVLVHSAKAVGYTLSCQTPPHQRTFSRVPAPKKPDDRQFKVGDRVTVSLSAGRVVDGVVKAVINRTDGIRLQVDYGKDETALVYLWQVRASDS